MSLRRGELREALAQRGDPLAVERLRRVLLNPRTAELPLDLDRADHLADLLAATLREGPPSGLSGSDLTRRTGRRKLDVLAVLDADGRFHRVGRGRSTRWRLQGTGREPHSRDAGADPHDEATPDLGGPENAEEVEAA